MIASTSHSSSTSPSWPTIISNRGLGGTLANVSGTWGSSTCVIDRNFPCRRELQFVSQITDAFQYLDGADSLLG